MLVVRKPGLGSPCDEGRPGCDCGVGFDRPACVIGAERFVTAALEQVADRALAGLPLIGSVDQVLDCTDILAGADLTSAMRTYYRVVGLTQ